MFYIILIFVLSFVVAVVAIQNSMPVQLSFFTWSFDSNLIVVVIMSVIVGLLIALLWGLKLKTQSFWRNRKLQDKMDFLIRENESLKKQIAQQKHPSELPPQGGNSAK